MNRRLAFLLGLLMWASASAQAATPESVIRHWHRHPRFAARLMLEKYGRPDQFDANSLCWFNNGPWKRTIVHRKALRHYANGPDKDYIEQTVGYLVSDDKV